MQEGIFDQLISGTNLTKNIWFRGLAGSSLSFAINSVFCLSGKNLLVVASDREKAAYLMNDVQAISGSENILFFPQSYRKPYLPEKTSNANVQERAEALNLLSKQNFHGMVFSYPEALCEKVALKRQLVSNSLQVNKGEKLSVGFISEFLASCRFERVDFVHQAGQYAIRGGIIDIFSFANEFPYRIELFGDEIDSIRSFDPVSQLSEKSFGFVTILPDITSTVFTSEKTVFLEYFDPAKNLILFDDVEYCADVLEKMQQEASEVFLKLESTIAQIPPAELYATPAEFRAKAGEFVCIETGLGQHISTETIQFSQKPQPVFNKNFELFLSNLRENHAERYTNYFFASNPKQAERLIAIFTDLLPEGENASSLFEHVPYEIHEGFIDEQLKIACYTDHQVFERYHRYKLRELKYKTQEALTIKEILTLNPGDYVTHIDHGIGRFAGLNKVKVGDKVQESVKLLFKDNDALFVSIHSLHRISKYSGKEGQVPRIDKLGGSAWQNLKQKTKGRVKELAFDLIKLYAERKTRPGHAFPPDNYLQHELEASFIFEDTPDQVKVTLDVKRDMEKPHPMDRLVCGDVGFGKTEIAIRAAFKAVCDGKQVAVLVPTTILAYQHYRTFSERMKDLPCNVAYVNRFRSASDQKVILAKLADGKIDIIIGTHKLANKDIRFKDLGLLVIDEEQKFGVSVKDKLKTFKTNVDTLTLTATPIPRTLQFSLMGARDLSVISTPPPNRYPVQTELHTFSEELIRDAVSFELQRGGQVFFVHNRVQNIMDVAGIIQRLLPDAKVAVGHGQMPGHKLEDVMMKFIEGEYDVLVSTSIVESGLDISNANTIIINEAHHFGLSDLHQLRGRVGRSNKKAFCYILAPPQILLTEEARKRLKALVDLSDLGSGFQIAMRDLDIRGAGNLLGSEQSGFINDMGFDTYMKILSEAMEELKEETWYKEAVGARGMETDKSAFSRQFVKDTTIDSDLQLLIPEEYVSNLSERLLLYRELDNITKEHDLRTFENNMRDRFGPVPDDTMELMNVLRLRWQAMKLGFEKLTLRNGKMLAYFISKKDSEYFSGPFFRGVLSFAHQHKSRCQLKEQKDKLYLVIEHVNSISQASALLSQIEAEGMKIVGN